MSIRIVEKNSFTVIGLSTQCEFSKLGDQVPKIWKELELRRDEIKNRKDEEYRLGLTLGRDGDIFNEAVGLIVDENTPVPQDMIKITVPAYQYAVLSHRGPDVQSSYAKIFNWLGENGHQSVPDQESLHHIEWYPESTFQNKEKGELTFDIYVRLAS